jgi:hypothetical protein
MFLGIEPDAGDFNKRPIVRFKPWVDIRPGLGQGGSRKGQGRLKTLVVINHLILWLFLDGRPKTLATLVKRWRGL